MTRDPKWFGYLLRDLREKRGLSLAAAAVRSGLPEVVIGSYERCDRRAITERGERLLDFYGAQIDVLPKGYDVQALLRERDELREFKRQILAAAEAAGLVVRPGLAAVPDERAA